MKIIISNFWDKWKQRIIQCGSFLDMQIGMELLVIDWAKEEPKMGQIIWAIFMFVANNSIFKLIMQYF